MSFGESFDLPQALLIGLAILGVVLLIAGSAGWLQFPNVDFFADLKRVIGLVVT